jgi:phosphomevalonate kinase
MMDQTTITVKSPGKLILLGEYAVLEKAPALVAAVNRHCKVRIESLYNSTFQVRTPNLNIPEIQFILDQDGDAHFRTNVDSKTQEQLHFVLAILKYVSQRSGKIPGASISIDTTSFYHRVTGNKFGLGSSAALTVSLLSGLMEYIGKNISDEDLYREAFLAHRFAQGKMGSGVDIAASATGGIISYTMPENANKLNGNIQRIGRPDNLYMECIWAGYAVSTRNFVRNVHTYKNEHPKDYDKLLGTMGMLSKEGVKAFAGNDTDAFLNIISDFFECERELGLRSGTEIVSDVHEEINSIVKAQGGTYKPSGAGGGDIGIAFCNDPDCIEKIRLAIKDSMFDLMNLEVQPRGVQISARKEIG